MDIYHIPQQACAHLHLVSQGSPSTAARQLAGDVELGADFAPPTEIELEDALAAAEIGIPNVEDEAHEETLGVPDLTVDVEGDALLRSQVAALRGHVDRLSRIEYSVITLRFGLVGEAWTVDQIAFAMQRSPATIRRIERRAIAKLRLLFGVEEDGNA
jgi:DNA-directed RNA polymerase specialized sigma subunit